MKIDWQKNAPVGLYISAVAALITGGLYLVTNKFDLPAQISAGFVIIGLALYAFLDPGRIRAVLTGRQARYGNNTLVMTLAFVGIFIIVNYLVHNNNYRWDFTQDKEHTLTTETNSALQKLPDKVVAEAYYTIRTPSDEARKLLDSYKFSSNGKFDYTFIDPETNPLAAQSSKVTRDGTIVLKMQGRMEQVTFSGEQDMTSALIRLSNPGKRAVYFLTGHGEADISGSGDTSLSMVKAALDAKNYTVQPLNLLSSPKIPDDALSIIIAGPQKPVSDQEVTLFNDFLKKGRSLVFLSEPPVVTNTTGLKDPLLDYFKNNWGIELQNDIVIDPSVNPPLIAVSNSYGEHPITQRLQSLATIFPTAHSVIASKNPPASVTLVNLVTTGQNAWGETDFASIENNQVSADMTKDVMGPVTVAYAGTNTDTKARVVVVGDVSFSQDKYYTNYANGDFIINSIDWAAEQENLINLTPKSPTTRTLIPPKQYTIGLLLLGVVFVMPGLVVLMGISTWLQRRKKG